MRCSHSFNSLENDDLITLLEQLVNIAGKRGSFDVKDVLYRKKTYLYFANRRLRKSNNV